MVKTAGQTVYDGRTVSYPGDGSAAPGDFVTFDAEGKITQTGDTDNAVGILSDQAGEAHDDGDNVPVHVTGVVIGNVATGTSAGDPLGASATAGEAGAGDKYDAFSDEGGEFKGANISDGYAAVHLG